VVGGFLGGWLVMENLDLAGFRLRESLPLVENLPLDGAAPKGGGQRSIGGRCLQLGGHGCVAAAAAR